MDRVIGTAGEFLIDRNQILHGGNLCRQDHLVLGHAEFLGARGRQQRRLHHGLACHGAGIARIGGSRILVHQLGEQLLVERAPVGADPHRLVVLVGDLDDVGKLRVALVLETDIAGIDAVLVERLGTGGIFRQQLVADVMEIADQRRIDAALAQAVADMRNGGGGFLAVDRDAHHFGPARERAATWAIVPSISAVSVLVIDCTTIGAPPPTATWPTLTWVVLCRALGPAMSSSGSFSGLFMSVRYQVSVVVSNGSVVTGAAEPGRLTRKSPAITSRAATPKTGVSVSCRMR